VPRTARPERRPINEGRDPLDRYCRACGALPGSPCTVKGLTSPEDVRTHEQERAWKLARIRPVRKILDNYHGREPLPIGEITTLLREANRTLIHESR
jgi:hypothetical protein